METQTIKQLSDIRGQRARQILEHSKPEILDENTYLVPSQFDSNKKYQVTHFDSYSCNCKDFEARCRGHGLYCKHIKAILLFEKLKNAYEVEKVSKEIELIIDTPQRDICPYCSCGDLIKSGKRKTQIGVKQRYECKDCHKRFVLTPIPKIKATTKLVCLAMDCYYRGLSYRDISAQFKEFYGLSLSHETIRGWVLRFTEVMEKYSKTLTPKTCGVWNADETMILSKRGVNKNKPNSNYDYVWNVMDNKSKFLLASINSGRSRSSKDAQRVFTEAYKQNGKIPYQIITDKNPSYQDGVRKTFRNWGKERKVKHTSILGHRKEINNNAIESHHSHQKEFHKIRRGVTETQTYADGFKVFHNFIRKNVKDKTTPAEKCGLHLNSINKWENLLLNGIENDRTNNIQKIKESIARAT
ncbi:MAG: DDE-type integrase/transposase/recombinase [Candidatus Pacearchaeota archaeon]